MILQLYWFLLFTGWQGATLAQRAGAAGQKQLQLLTLWDQCGGVATCEAHKCADAHWEDTSCPKGATCKRLDQWFWQCQPDPAAGSTASPTPAPSARPANPQAKSLEEPKPAAASAKHLQLWEQCGGESQCNGAQCIDKPWPKSSCPARATCQRETRWFWQCRPGQADQAHPADQARPAHQAHQADQAAGDPTGESNVPAASELDASTATAPAPAAPTAQEAPPDAGLVPEGVNAVVNENCSPYIDTQQYRTTNFTDTLNKTTKVSPFRANADRPRGEWIPGRATFYAASEAFEAAHVACGEPPGQYGILEQGSCGFTNGDGSLVYPKEVYAAAASANIDYAGSCGRCYQLRCKTSAVRNNGRPLRISDLQYGRPYPKLTDDYGRVSPGNPRKTEDLVFVQCWDESKTVTVRIGDSCPCKYHIKDPPEIRTQHWCCGGHNHFDISYWAFQQLAHPSYGVMPLEYRPVDCTTNEPLDPFPGFVSKVLYKDDLQPGWGWRPYFSKNFVLLSAGAGLDGSTAMCATLSQKGAVALFCRGCTEPKYQPFVADKLEFWIRSNTPASADMYASSTPAGKVPGLKVFLMKDEDSKFCGQDVLLGDGGIPSAKQQGDWYFFSIPLSTFACQRGSTGSLANVDRIDFQNIEIRDADVCLDSIALVGS